MAVGKLAAKLLDDENTLPNLVTSPLISVFGSVQD